MMLIYLTWPLSLFGQTTDFFNVLSPKSADHRVIRHIEFRSAWYIMTSLEDGGVMLHRSRSIVGLVTGQSKLVWQPTKNGPASEHLRSPKLHRVNNKWYILFSADDGQEENRRVYALENSSSDPFQGQFVLKGKVFDPLGDYWATDATILDLNKRLYLIWSGSAGKENIRTMIYIAPMSDPFTLSGSRIELSRPIYTWEKKGGDRKRHSPETNEGPEILPQWNLIHIVYSAGVRSTDDACLGMLTAKVTDDPLQVTAWKKSQQPVFHSGNGLNGLTRFSFVKAPDGNEDWMIYSATQATGDEINYQCRIQPFTWDKSAFPLFGTPSPPNLAIPLPRGEPLHVRYEAENAQLGGASRIFQRAGASGMSKVGRINTPQSSVEFAVTAKAEGKHDLIVRYANGSERNQTSSHEVMINDKSVGEISYPNTGGDNWSNAIMTVDLKQGKNTIRFKKLKESAELDCIDLVPTPR